MRPMPPSDLESALSWGVNCGPAALAAALGVQISAVRSAVSSGGEFKGFMGVSDMLDALSAMRAKVERIVSKIPASGELDMLARTGPPRLVLVQWKGPWEAHYKRAAQYRHWIANVATEDETWIYDVNEDDWVLFEHWRDVTMPALQPPKATGWRFDWVAEVRR